MSAALAAMIGLSILICLGVLTWDDALEQKGAWDTLLWFAILISMSGRGGPIHSLASLIIIVGVHLNLK